MKRILALSALALISTQAFAQQFFSNSRVVRVTQTHSTVGTSTAAAISASSVAGNMLSFKICNDAINTSTYLLVGQAADAATDGVMLDKGQCFECENCQAGVLKLLKVKAQAATNGYSIIQYRN